MKRKILLLFICLICVTGNVYADNDEVEVYINGESIDFDVTPKVVNNRTVVPMRAIFEALGASVIWCDETQTVTGQKGETNVIMRINDKVMMVNDKEIFLDVPPYVEQNRTLVPVRAIAESFGVDVLWYNDINTVAIYENKNQVQYKLYYNLKGEYVSVDTNFEEKYIELGWSEDLDDIKRVLMYAPDGRVKYVVVGRVQDEIKVGWYTEPVITMYAYDGRTRVTKKTEVEAYEKVGWCVEPLVKMYAEDGRTKYVKKSEVEANKKVGWYENKEEIEQKKNRKKADSLAYDKSKCGGLQGIITYQYNKFIGTRADVGAKVLLIQINHIPLDTDNLNIGFLNDYDDPLVYCAKVDGLGNYYFDNIPAGRYYLLVSSSNTNESPEIQQINYRLAELYLKGKVSAEALSTLKLTIECYSFEIKEIEIKPNQVLRYSKDWGYTYI